MFGDEAGKQKFSLRQNSKIFPNIDVRIVKVFGQCLTFLNYSTKASIERLNSISPLNHAYDFWLFFLRFFFFFLLYLCKFSIFFFYLSSATSFYCNFLTFFVTFFKRYMRFFLSDLLLDSSKSFWSTHVYFLSRNLFFIYSFFLFWRPRGVLIARHRFKDKRKFLISSNN